MGIGIRVALFAAALGLAAMPAVSPSASTMQKGMVLRSEGRFDFRCGFFGGANLGGRSGRRAGYGGTNRHQQRVARKKRNQARHRRACRG